MVLNDVTGWGVGGSGGTGGFGGTGGGRGPVTVRMIFVLSTSSPAGTWAMNSYTPSIAHTASFLLSITSESTPMGTRHVTFLAFVSTDKTIFLPTSTVTGFDGVSVTCVFGGVGGLGVGSVVRNTN